MEVVASLSQGRTPAAQCGLFTYKSVPVIFEPPCNSLYSPLYSSPHRSVKQLHKYRFLQLSEPATQINRIEDKMYEEIKHLSIANKS